MDIPYHITMKHHLFGKVEAHETTVMDASRSLNLSYRQTLRWWKRYRGAAGSLIDFGKPCGYRGGFNRKPGSLITAVIDCKKTHPHRSAIHIAEVVSEEHGNISPPTVWRILRSADLLGGREKTERIFTRFEAASFGERLQMDTTSGSWLPGYRLVYLIAVIDDYSRMLLGWKWVDSDSAWNNMKVLRSVYEKYGLPATLYTDNASMFKTIRHGKSAYQTHRQDGYETEIQRCMRELGVIMFSHKPYEPQSKGKVERFFRFVQERFVREHTAKSILELNDQFEIWAAWYNAKHVNRTTAQKPKDRMTPSVFHPVPDRRRLDSAFSFKTTRKVDKCNTVKFEGQFFTLKTKQTMFRQTVDLETTPFEVRIYQNGVLLQCFDRENI